MIDLADLTEEEQLQIGKELLAAERPPVHDTRELVELWIPSVVGVRPCDWPVCENHQPPATFLYYVFERDERGRLVHSKVLYVSNRTGGKSFNAALAQWIKCLAEPKREGRILGGSGEQARECYKHTVALWDSLDGRLWRYLAKEPLEKGTYLKHGGFYAVQKASHTSVRGSHPNDLTVDEADEVRSDIYEAALSQPHRKHGLDKQLIVTSTINKAGGIVEDLVRTAKERRMASVVCCWREVTATCTIEEECPTCILWPKCQGVMKEPREAILVERDEEGEELRVAVKHVEDYHETWVYPEHILSPKDPMKAEIGDRMLVEANPHGYLDTRDVGDVYSMVSEETWDSEWESEVRQPLGAVLKRHHVQASLREMNYRKDPPLAYDKKMRHTWLGIDWGYTNETCVVVFQWDGLYDLRIIAEAHWTEKTGDALADAISDVAERYKTNLVFCDNDPDKIAYLKRKKLKVRRVLFGKWKDSCLEALRVWIQMRGSKRLTINDRLTHLIGALEKWRYKDKFTEETAEKAILKVDDHPCDATLAGMRRFATLKKPRAKIREEKRDTLARYKGVR